MLNLDNKRRVWGYGLLLAVCVAAVINAPSPQIVGPTHESRTFDSGAASHAATSNESPGFTQLPGRPILEAATSDPFAASQPVQSVASRPILSAAPPSTVPAALLPPQQPAPVQQPLAPPLGLRYVGQIKLPDQTQVIFASDGQVDFALQLGTTLPNGYVVEAIGSRQVAFSYPPLKTTASMDLPPAPLFETR